MAADLHIHVFEGITEEDLAAFFAGTLGSKWFASGGSDYSAWVNACGKVSKTPNVWVGEVSWLKAALFKDGKTFILDPVLKVQEAIGEDLPVLDDSLVELIMSAFESKNTTGYGIADSEDVQKFLTEYKGKRLFTVSW